MKFKWPYSTIDNFYPRARQLRAYYEEIYDSPREAEPRRFSFDPWYIKDQFNQLKTPAGSFFRQDLAKDFFEHLVDWGRVHLGCQMISPPWLSLYLDGHYQNWHADNPQGPFAFVFSLSPQWSARQGGQTFLLKKQILNYWTERDFSRGLEQDDIYQKVMPKFNRLLIFDPRIPHRVEPVRDVFDPLEGRLVVHGWFVEPRPQLDGSLKPAAALPFLEDHVGAVLDNMPEIEDIKGYLCFRLKIQPNGKLKSIETLVSTLIFKDGDVLRASRWAKSLQSKLANYTFKSASGASVLTLPIQFS